MNRLSNLFEKIPNNATPHEQARIEFSNRMRIALARTRAAKALSLGYAAGRALGKSDFTRQHVKRRLGQ